MQDVASSAMGKLTLAEVVWYRLLLVPEALPARSVIRILDAPERDDRREGGCNFISGLSGLSFGTGDYPVPSEYYRPPGYLRIWGLRMSRPKFSMKTVGCVKWTFGTQKMDSDTIGLCDERHL